MNELKHAIATKKHLFCIVAGIFLTVLFAASPEISFYSKLIFHPALPKKIIDLWAIFRSTGRMIWPVVYWIMIAAVCTVPSYVKKKKYAKPVLIIWTILLMTALGLQGYDLHKKIGERHAEFAKKTIYESPLQSNFWKDVMQFRDKKHLLFVDKDNLSQGELYAFSDYAADHGMTINNFYFARALTEPLQEVADDFMEHCDTQTIYVFTWKSRMRTADYNLHYYQVDDWLVGLKEPIKGYEEIQVEEMMNWHAEFDGTFVNEGEDDKGVRTLHSGGVSYGPYMELPEGHYRVTVQGEHLSNAYCLAYHKGSELYRFEPVSEKKTDQAVIYEIMIDQEVKDIEFVVRNQSEEDVILYGIYVQYLPY
ncbi:MAG: hypothetical protein GX567_12490 [Clostridia bacterium]|nr:hypothetical protein [Clostridia bacterium]